MGAAHDWFSWVVIFANAAVGVWALAAQRRPSLRIPALWAATAAAQLTVFVQAGLGTWLIVAEGRQAPELHALYGFSGLVAVGVAYSYRPHLRAQMCLLYGFTGLFLMGLGIRAVLLDSAI
ncbi:MAG: hypothetical protein OXE79_04645 [Acidimicrobiaceae bacterium]|nr:hypothetical protein [Acidimicrobiaceae bacterium]MCY4176689.1 hypothetical protein [Acidimicrobiaceae bacterium]MCY4281238.1 hypothetical protein [Acidimicrobiaceae bacterium]MCY4294264.1 hypothetical protein [Acidimicrobiaceae bacterium]